MSVEGEREAERDRLQTINEANVIEAHGGTAVPRFPRYLFRQMTDPRAISSFSDSRTLSIIVGQLQSSP